MACRLCFKLRCPSQTETLSSRACRAMHKIRWRLDPRREDYPGDLPRKPKGMHWRTYERDAARHQAYSELWSAAVLTRLTRL